MVDILDLLQMHLLEKGRYDFKLLQALGIHFHPQTESLQERGERQS
ncbi:MAG: hypothetical protein ACRCZS_24915 [Chroococcidiopsis sp.]